MTNEEPNRVRNQIKEQLERKRAELAEFQTYMENLKASGISVDMGACIRTMTVLGDDITLLERELAETIEIVE
jgi:hypothetical protein